MTTFLNEMMHFNLIVIFSKAALIKQYFVGVCCVQLTALVQWYEVVVHCVGQLTSRP